MTLQKHLQTQEILLPLVLIALVANVANAAANWLLIYRLGMGLDVAPFCVQAEAPMHLVHFYFSQLTLNSVFVVDRGRFVGMINKADMINAKF